LGWTTSAIRATGSGAHPGLFFVGYQQPSTGLLREIAIQAVAVADAIARA
jgi:hypothetical protein